MNILSVSENANPNYLATIVRLEDLRPHENADKLQLAYVLGSIVVTGLDAKVGDIYIYFPVESAICKKFLSWANLFSDATLNSDTLKKGMFSKSGRVKMLRIRTIYSNGFILPFAIVQEYIRQVYKKNVEPKVEYSFDSIGDDIFVQKYVVPVKIGTSRNLNKSKGNVKKFDKLVPMQHSFYPDTLNLRKVIGEELNPDDEIVISKKYHGCVKSDTILITKEYGEITIGEIVDKKIEVSVKSFDIRDQKVVWSKVEEFYNHRESEDWYEIETENGVKIVVTGNHPVYLPELNCYRQTKYLKEGDEVLVY